MKLQDITGELSHDIEAPRPQLARRGFSLYDDRGMLIKQRHIGVYGQRPPIESINININNLSSRLRIEHHIAFAIAQTLDHNFKEFLFYQHGGQ